MKVIFLDRDGIINFDSKNYIKSPDEWLPIPKSIEAIVKLSKHGYKVGVATNQSGIARGYYDEEVLAKIHQKMTDLVKEAGGEISHIVYCPHMPDAGCECRKPKPGMLKQLANFFECDIENVPFVGDRMTDIKAAKSIGAKPIHIRSQMSEAEIDGIDVPKFDTLFDYVDTLVKDAG